MTAQSARFLRKIGEVELLTLRAAILFSNVPRRRAPGFQAVGDGGDKNIGTIYFSQFLPPPLSRFDTPPQAIRLGTFETKMAASEDRCSITGSYGEIGDCERSNDSSISFNASSMVENTRGLYYQFQGAFFNFKISHNIRGTSYLGSLCDPLSDQSASYPFYHCSASSQTHHPGVS